MKTLLLFLLLVPALLTAADEVFFHKGQRLHGQVHFINPQEGWVTVSAREADGKQFRVWIKDLDTATRVKIGVATAAEIQQNAAAQAEAAAAAAQAAAYAAQIHAAQARESRARIQAAYANSVTTAPANAEPTKPRIRTYHEGVPGTWVSDDGKHTIIQGVPGTAISISR